MYAMRGELDRDLVGGAQRVRGFEQGDDDRAAHANARRGLGAAQRGVGGRRHRRPRRPAAARRAARLGCTAAARSSANSSVVTAEMRTQMRGRAAVVAVEHGAHHVAGDGGLAAGNGTFEVEDHGIGVECQRFAHAIFAIRGYEEDAANGMYVDTCVSHGVLLVVRRLTESGLTESRLSEKSRLVARRGTPAVARTGGRCDDSARGTAGPADRRG